MEQQRKSPVINDSDEFIPMGTPQAAHPEEAAPPPPEHPETQDTTPSQEPFVEQADSTTSPVYNNSADFVPMPTPNQVVHMDRENARLDAVPFEFADIRALAQRILKRAQEQGQAKIESARKQVAQMEKQAYDKAYKEAFEKGKEDGLKQGVKEGMAQSDQKVATAIEAEKESMRQNAAPVSGVLQELADAINSSRQQLLAQAEGDLLLLALDLAKRLVGHELSIDPEAIRPLAVECIDLVTDRTSIDVRVNPEDHNVMTEFYPELQTIFPDLGPVKIIPDPQIERGGLYAATRETEVDMRLATRLAAFEEVILGFSGDAAIPPWSQIPTDAIEAARAASAESAYSLPMGEEEPQQHPALHHEEEQTYQQPQQEAIPASEEHLPRQDDAAATHHDSPVNDGATGGIEGDADVSPEELQAAMDMVAGIHNGSGGEGQGVDEQDLADLAELADLAGGQEQSG